MNILLPLLYTLGFGLLGYLCGSLPFAIWITRLVKGVDVREAGSGHATTTNTIRQAGFGPGTLVLVLDNVKGFLPTWLVLHVGRDAIPPYTWLAPLTAALVVIGHCWPIFAGFRGGMGNARASLLTGLLMAPTFWLLGLGSPVIWIAAATGIVLAGRFTIDWKRQYRELWLDREKPQG